MRYTRANKQWFADRKQQLLEEYQNYSDKRHAAPTTACREPPYTQQKQTVYNDIPLSNSTTHNQIDNKYTSPINIIYNMNIFNQQNNNYAPTQNGDNNTQNLYATPTQETCKVYVEDIDEAKYAQQTAQETEK